MKTKILLLTGLLCFMSAVVSAQTVYVNSSPSATFRRITRTPGDSSKTPTKSPVRS